MKKLDILYANLITLIQNLTLESDNFVAFHDSKEEPKQEQLISISELISKEKEKITKTLVHNKSFHQNFQDLMDHLSLFESIFPEYPGLRKSEILAIISILQKLYTEYNESDIDLDEEIDTQLFSLMKVDDVISQENFIYFDTSDLENSLLLINIYNEEEFNKFIDEAGAGTNLLFYLLSKIGLPDSPLGEGKHVLVKTAFETKTKMVLSTLYLHIVKSGKIVHEPHEYTLPPSISSDCAIQLGNSYQQFADSIDIISEYNYQKDILDKYLRIYHVIENFMFKRPLVDIEKNASGEVFSIRHFKRMYDSVSQSEIKTLKKLISSVMELAFNPTTTFQEKYLAEWEGLVTEYFAGDDSKVNSLLEILNITSKNGNYLKYSDIDIGRIADIVSKLIYSFRNSMVHNRETEFHLTHFTLNYHPVIGNTARVILENFVLPLLEEISFHLIINNNNLVWYDSPTLRLWHED